jgi:hypothetical protein
MRITVWQAAMATASVILGCSCAASNQPGTTGQSSPTRITCPPGPRVDAVYDVFTGPRSEDSPQDIGERYADAPMGEKAVIVAQSDRSAQVMILRKDGSAHTKLGLRYTSFAGWHVALATACDSRILRNP